MHQAGEATTALGPYRVLDLTEGGFNLCGRVLADLGADVIKVEPPGGSPTRMRGPFYGDEADPERSLYWYAYCVNKRGITLNLESLEGRRIFRELVATSDFVLESFPPGYMGALGLGYDALSRVNPGLIVTSITPFGQSGPHSRYKATDMVAWAMGGMQYISGDSDRPPVRIGFPQAELNAGGQAAAGSMVALWHRQKTGEGQHVDVSMQIAVIWTLMNATPFPQLHKTNLERAGAFRTRGSLVVRHVFPCKDGHVTTMLAGRSISPIVQWMDEEGVAPDFARDYDWDNLDLVNLTAQGESGFDEFVEIQRHIENFFATKTKAELYERAISHRILLAPCNTVGDIARNPQLRARGFWIDVYHPELGASVTHLGPYIKFSEMPISTRRRAPLIGEHNDEILAKELGLSGERLAELGRLGAI